MEPRLDIVGAALADPSRIRILCELMDGRSHTGKELASVAGVAANTASGHLGKLIEAGIVAAEKSGRCIYYRVASAEIAEVLEQMSALSPTDHLYRAHGTSIAPELIARTCYNHIAGRLGVLLAREMTSQGLVSVEGTSARVTEAGAQTFAEIGIWSNGTPLPDVKCCLDWSERRQHFSGQLGTALLSHALSQNWVTRPRNGRALAIEPTGYDTFERYFGVKRADLSGQADPQ
ncbi:ArsR/SmtB family transcription factor [Sulfitobacter sp. 1A13421]|uniref:ArsR/SmtB family transcription factor n=1 Tax=Sulfitobacter sp. 1A13421 TaxID=3368595 RepID=UPI003747C859